MSGELSDAKKKEIETRKRLGPRLPRSKPAKRTYGDGNVLRTKPSRNRLPSDHGRGW